jgi:DNA-3-methyladenine glycosylase
MVDSDPRAAKVIPRSFFDRDPVLVAPELLGKVLEHGGLAGRIVEVEAYRGSSDAASHAFRGKTARNATMFGPPGSLYVYFTYGMHHCANVVCWPEGEPGAVLIRALAPLAGLEEMAARRFGPGSRARPVLPGLKTGAGADRRTQRWRSEDLCSGPAKLCQAFGLDRSADGYDLVSGLNGVVLVDDGAPPPARPEIGTRIGLAARCTAMKEPWRWWIPGDANVSRPRSAR